MPPKSLQPGQRLSLNRSELPLPPSSSSSISAPPPPTVDAIVVSRIGATGRTWKVRIDSDNVELSMSSRAIYAATVSAPAPPREENLRSRRPPDRGPMISYVEGEADDDGSEDSLDEKEEENSDIDPDDGKVIPPPPDPLIPHGLRWTPLAAEQILVEQRAVIHMDMHVRWSSIGLQQFGSSATRFQADSQDPARRRPIHYFLLSFPVDLVHGIVERTNTQIREAVGRQSQLTTQFFFKLIGIIYLMTLCEQPNRRSFWQPAQGKALPSPNFGRFMEISFFEHFIQHLSWSASNPADRWAAVRDLFVGFNARRVATIVPSDRLTVDEAMSANRTNKTVNRNVQDGLPQQTKIARKPEGVGSEIRCVIDGRTQVMLQLELQESKEEMAKKK